MTRIGNRPPPAARRPIVPAEDKTPRLKIGMRGPEVRKLETALKERGLIEGKVDSYFGQKTKAAIMKYERDHGWKVNGIVGDRIRRKLGLDPKGPEIKGGGPKPPSDAGGSGSTTFKTVNVNVKSNPEMPQRKVLHDVKKAAKQGSLIGWNEIGPQRYREAIKSLGPKWGHFFPKDGKLNIPNPISWDKSVWQKQDAGFKKTHNGKAKVSPNRYITWVKLKNKETGESIVRVNTHFVSGAWSSPKATTEWRRDKWNIHAMKLSNMVDKLKKKGETVIIGGDFNRDSYKVLGNKVAYDNNLHVGTHGKSTLDYVMHVPDANLKKKGAQVQGGYASDHDAVVVQYQLKGDKK